MTNATGTTVRAFEFRTEGENTGVLKFIDAMRGLIARTNGKDTDTMVLKAGGMQAMLMSMMGMAAFLVVTKNEELANILSDTLGFSERDDGYRVEEEMPTAFADDGTLGLMGLLEGVQSDNYDALKAEVENEAAQADEAPAAEEAPVVPDEDEEELGDDEDDWYDDDEDEDDDWDDDDWEDEDDYEDD